MPTTNYNFVKHDPTEFFSVEHSNDNLDKIDSELKNVNNKADLKAPMADPVFTGTPKIGAKKIATEDQIPSGVTVANNLTETVPGKALDAVQGKILAEQFTSLSGRVDDMTLEKCIVSITTDDTKAVEGQIITLTNITDGTKTENYTLLTGETAHTFKVFKGNHYKVKVNSKTGYATPQETTEFTAVEGYTRNVTMQYQNSTPNNWELWCIKGGLNPATYGSLANVVASQTVMNTLANSTQAVDYMILSTGSIMTAVVGSVNAMTQIGKSSYATSKFILNSTWTTAILANSSAIAGLDSSNPISIPTMFGNTSPSGICSSNNYSGADNAYAFKAFDKDVNTKWLSLIDTTLSQCYIDYEFPTEIFPYRITCTLLSASSYASTRTFKIQKYNGSSYVDITDSITTGDLNSTTQSFSLNPTKNTTGTSKKFRIQFISGTGNVSFAGVSEFNIVGK